MSRRYDSKTTTFSPEGRLYQVEYAIEAISQAGAGVGVLAKEGVVLAAEKRIHSKLLDMKSSSEKLYIIDDHIVCAVAGITSDAAILINYARLTAQRYRFTYQSPMPIEQLMHQICDLKQNYTQRGGLRPFGVAFLFGAWDRHHDFQLFQSDPSGNYGGWKAFAIGANSHTADSLLKSDYKSPKQMEMEEKEQENDDTNETELMEMNDAIFLALHAISKTLDTSKPTSDKIELATLTRDDATGEIIYKFFDKEEIEEKLQPVLKELEKSVFD